jgi:cytochrome c biogenesis protein CcmG/thiol:disulfide interchange protein DsbE
MRKPAFLKFALFILLAVYSSFYSCAFAEDAALPSFSIPTVSGSSLSNKSLQGKVCLLNVWASWCRYCYYEHAMLMKIKNQYKVPIYGIALKDNTPDIKAWLREHGNPYVAVGEDTYGTASDKLNVSGTPQTFVIDKHGRIRYQQSGGIDQSTWNNTLWPLIQKLQAEN